jgi:hypothetical protein
MDGDVAVFRLQDVDLYGLPYLFGYDNYIVTSTLDDECPMVLDWKGENERRGALRPIHRYSRVERFIGVLYQLLGYRGDIPQEVLDVVRFWGIEVGQEWNSVRFILKQYEWSRYYNRIPGILWSMGVRNSEIEFWKVEEIICKFQNMSCNFDSNQFEGRIYFPNLRYVALRLLEEYGMEFAYHIPKIRTKRKDRVMRDIYDKLYVYSNK